MTDPPSAWIYYVQGDELFCVRHPVAPMDTVCSFLKRHGFSVARVEVRKNGKRTRLLDRVFPGDQITHRPLRGSP